MKKVATPKQLEDVISSRIGSITQCNLTDKFNRIADMAKKIKLKYNKIKLSSSSIHGRGVFATANIPKDTIVTFYPVDSFSLMRGKEQDNYIKGRISKEFDENFEYYQSRYTWGSYSNIFGDYGVTGDPFKHHDTHFLGHMLNDGVGNVFEKTSYEDLHSDKYICQEIFGKYTEYTETQTNCEIQDLDDLPIVFIVTTKDIQAGEELLTHYGEYYWYAIEYKKDENVEEEVDKLFEKFGLNDV